MIKLYHGSDVEITSIDLNKSKIGKDFGCGFYLSPNYQQALKQAENTAYRRRTFTPKVTSFIYDETLSGTLKVKVFEDYSEDWANFIVLNRNNMSRTPAHDYDIVYGPIADDTVGVQLRRYLENYIDIAQLVRELKFLKGITFQYFFGTEAAISALKKCDNI